MCHQFLLLLIFFFFFSFFVNSLIFIFLIFSVIFFLTFQCISESISSESFVCWAHNWYCITFIQYSCETKILCYIIYSGWQLFCYEFVIFLQDSGIAWISFASTLGFSFSITFWRVTLIICFLLIYVRIIDGSEKPLESSGAKSESSLEPHATTLGSKSASGSDHQTDHQTNKTIYIFLKIALQNQLYKFLKERNYRSQFPRKKSNWKIAVWKHHQSPIHSKQYLKLLRIQVNGSVFLKDVIFSLLFDICQWRFHRQNASCQLRGCFFFFFFFFFLLSLQVFTCLLGEWKFEPRFFIGIR